MRLLISVLFLAPIVFADSYQKCQLVEITVDKTDTICICKNIRTKGILKINSTRFKERPLSVKDVYTIRNRPYKKHTTIVFELPIQGFVADTTRQ
jgi:hypothetical protein